MNDQFNPDDVLKKMYAALNPAVASEMLKSSTEASEELTKVYQNMLESYSAFLTQASTEVLDDLQGKLKDAKTQKISCKSWLISSQITRQDQRKVYKH